MRASNDAFDALHALFAEGLSEELQRQLDAAREPTTILDPDGKKVANPAYRPLSPQFLNQVRGFLKDNGVDTPASSQRVNDLADALKGLDMDALGDDRHFN